RQQLRRDRLWLRRARRMVAITMVRIEPYQPATQDLWNDYVVRSKNGTFLVQRQYMDYHADRFHDHSLLFFEENSLIGLLPANIRNGIMFSHGGLTYGGIVADQRMKTALMLHIFEALKQYLCDQGVHQLVYKPVPHIYHQIPAEEDLYALFLHGAVLVRRDISSAIWMQKRITLGKGRKWSAKRAKKNGIEVKQSGDFQGFMAIEKEHLEKKYRTSPTHTGAELEMLASRFPENIKLYGAYRG